MESNITKIFIKKFQKRCVTLPWIAHMRYGPPLLVLTFTDVPPLWGPSPPPSPKKKRTFPKVMMRTIAIHSDRCEEKWYPFTLQKKTSGASKRCQYSVTYEYGIVSFFLKKNDKMTTSFSFGKTASLKKLNRYQFSPASKGIENIFRCIFKKQFTHFLSATFVVFKVDKLILCGIVHLSSVYD